VHWPELVCAAQSRAPEKRSSRPFPRGQAEALLFAAGGQARARTKVANAAACIPGVQPGCRASPANTPYMFWVRSSQVISVDWVRPGWAVARQTFLPSECRTPILCWEARVQKFELQIFIAHHSVVLRKCSSVSNPGNLDFRIGQKCRPCKLAVSGSRTEHSCILSSSLRSTFMHRSYSVCRLPESICPEHVQDAYQTILVKHMLCNSLTNQQQQLYKCVRSTGFSFLRS
jgi:hypothetical protein